MLELIASVLGMIAELVFTLLVQVPGILVDLVLKPGNEVRSNRWLLAVLGVVFYGMIISPILLAIVFGDRLEVARYMSPLVV